MIHVQILCVGKLKESYLREACSEYLKRLSRYCDIEITELSEYRLPENPGTAQIQKALEEEGKQMLTKLKGYVIPLCIEGKEISSEGLSAKFDEIALNYSDITFVIGSSFGIADLIKAKGNFKLSLSPMTFPHQLARVMLLEQIYRGFSILSGGKYHK